MKKYLIVYGSSRQDDGAFISTSRDTKKHGQEVLGTAGGGWVFAYVGRNEDVEDILERKLPWIPELEKLEIVSLAQYTPKKGWISGNIPVRLVFR